jgi:hypothetical protein
VIERPSDPKVKKSMRFLSIPGKILFIFLPLGCFGPILAIPGIELFVNASGLDPFDEKGDFQSWFPVIIVLLWILGSVGAFFLLSWINRIPKKYLKIPVQTIYAWLVFSSLFGGGTIMKVIMENFAWEKRLMKVIKYYGIKEDMCQALRLGMDEAEVVQVMGQPESWSCSPGELCTSVMYCPHSNPCRSLDYNSARKVIQMECWNGSIKHQ